MIKKILIHILLAFTVTLFLNMVTYAVEPSLTPKPPKLPGPSVEQQLEEGTGKILTESVLPKYAASLIAFMAGGALLFTIIGGVRLVVAYGDDEAIEKGKKQIIYALVGFIVAMLAYTVVTAIINFDFTKT